MRLRRWLMSVVLLAASGCSSLDAGDALVGTWGGDGIELRSTNTHASLTLPCSTVEFSEPLVIGEDGAFTAAGVEHLWALNGEPTVSFHLSGIVRGDDLMVGYYQGDPELPPPVAAHILTPNGFHQTIACLKAR